MSTPADPIKALAFAGFERAMVALLDLGSRAVPALLSAVAAGGVSGERAAAVLRVQIDHALPRLRAGLRSWHAPTVVRAARVLGRLGSHSTLTALREAQASGDPERAAAALRYLGVIAHPAALAPVVAAAEPAARRVAELAPALIALLRRRSPAVGEAAALALGSIRDPRAVAPLLALLPRARPDLQRVVISALGLIGDGRAVAPLLALGADPAAERATRIAALHTVGWLGDTRAVEPLLALLATAGRPLTPALLAALGALGDPRATPALLAILDGPDKGLRVAAAYALGRLGDPAALPALRARLRDPRRVRKPIQRAILLIALRQRRAR